VSAIPKALSPGEEAFALHCRAEKLEPKREYPFHLTRKWRFDFYFPDAKLAVEVEGGYGGRHQRGGFQSDIEKYNAAAMMGITVLRYTTKMVTDGTAIDEVLAILKGEGR
jgi:very-short-patch-repair endonuclease